MSRDSETSVVYKEYEKRVKSIVLSGKSENDSLLFFPKDNVEIENIPVKREKNEVIAPPKYEKIFSKLPLFARKSIEILKAPQVRVKYNFKNYNKIDTSEIEKTIKQQKYEADIDLKKERSQNVKKKKSHITPSVSKTRKKIKSHIHAHFSFIYDQIRAESEYEWAGGAEKKICKRKPYKEVYNLDKLAFIVHVKKFETRFTEKWGDVEPLFLTLALYDVGAKKKISENFYVDLVDDMLIQIIKNGGIVRNDRTKLRNGIFHVDRRNADIVMVVVVNKILEGNEDEVCDRYVSPEKVKENDLRKIKKNVMLCCERYGFLYQPVAYTMIQVFDDDEQLILDKDEKHVFYRTNGNVSILNLLTEDPEKNSRKSLGTKKIRTIPAVLQLEVVPLEDYNPIHKGLGIISVNKKILAKEVVQFPVTPEDKFNTKYSNCLFIYPKSVYFPSKALTGKSPKNVTIRIQLKEDDDKINDANTTPAIYGKSSQDLLVSTRYTKVSVNKKNPEFNDEIKVQLPGLINKRHHILFSFFNVQVQAKSSKQTLSPLGHSMLRLTDDNGRIAKGSKELDIYDAKKSTNYLKKFKKRGGRFKCRFISTSEIYCPQKYIAEAFANPRKHIRRLVKGFDKDSIYFIRHTPVIFSLLFEIICSSDDSKLLTETYLVMLDVVEKITKEFPSDTGRNEKLLKYVQDVFVNPKSAKNGYPFFQISHLWLSLLRDGQSKRKGNKDSTGSKPLTKSIQYCWFYCDLIVKSIVLYLKTKKVKGRLNDKNFNRILGELVDSLSIECIFRAQSGLSLAKELNSTLALFFRDLFNVMDRGVVLLGVSNYLRKISELAVKQKELIQELRITFLQIISDYEHYVPMSLPKKYKITTVNIENRLCDLSFLCGIVMRQCIVDVCDLERTVRQRSFNLIKELLTKHEFDEKYQDDDQRKRVIGMYFPFVLFFLDRFEKYKEISGERLGKNKELLKEAEEEFNSVEAKLEQQKTERENLKKGEVNLRLKLDEIIKHQERKLKEEKEKVDEAKKQYEEEKIRVKLEYQHILFSVITILFHMDRTVLSQWFKVENPEKVVQFLKLLKDCVTYFEYRGKEEIKEKEKKYASDNRSGEKTLREAKELLESLYSTSGSTLGGEMRSLASERRNSLKKQTFGGRPSLQRRSLKRPTLSRPALSRRGIGNTGTTSKEEEPSGRKSLRGSLIKRNTLKKGETKKIDAKSIKKIVKWEGILASQVAFTVLDVLIDLVKAFKGETRILSHIFDLTLLFFETKQSERAMDCFFDYMKVFVEVYRNVIYLNNTPYSEKICGYLLRKCHSPVEKIRSKAAAVLYLLIKNNYLEMGNFTRTKTQTTTMLSGLVSDLDENAIGLLHTCFKAIAQYAQEDEKIKVSRTLRRKKSKESGGFTEQVVAVVEKLKTTLSKTRKITKYRNDKNAEEKLIQLFLRLSHSYSDAPELCVTWYRNLADYHRGRERYIESAQCLCLIAGYSYQYLQEKNHRLFRENGRLDYKLLEKCSPTLKNEKFSELKSLFKEGEGPTFASTTFTVNGFVDLLKDLLKLFEKGKYYEYKINICKLLIQYYEGKENYEKLRKYHLEIANNYKIISKIMNDNRMFGEYYYIGLYGAMLRKENGKEYLYKFPKISKLRDVMEYVEKIFGGKYGQDNIKIVSSSFQITKDVKTDKKKVYVKIISVKPYFGRERRKTAYFDRNVNMKRFIFETPFTKGGKKSHGNIELQCKRKTIVEVDVPFPSLSFKVPIMDQEEEELSPIQNSIEIVEKSIGKLKSFQKITKIDVNTLQLVLSGTVIPQVQEGIPAIIRVFLTSKYEKNEFIGKLKEKLREFLKYNMLGIRLNGKWHTTKQEALHQQFIIGYKKLHSMISAKVKGCDPYSPRNISGGGGDS